MRIPQTVIRERRSQRTAIGREPATVLTFHGPFTFTKGDAYLFNTRFVKSEGIYIWTIRDEVDNVNYVHYIGETVCFGRRQRQHLIQITGLNHRILDADFARQGLEKVIWSGMSADKTRNAAAHLLENYNEVSKKVIAYIGLINVYFAPTTFDLRLRRHIEDCIGWNLRTKYPELRKFYPDEDHVCRMGQRLSQRLTLHLPEEIAGIDWEQTI